MLIADDVLEGAQNHEIYLPKNILHIAIEIFGMFF